MTWLQVLKQHRAIAVIRASERQLGYQMAMAVVSGGMEIIEITWNSAEAGSLIAQLRLELPHCWIGTGTILNMHHLKDAIATGAQFLFAPHVDPNMITYAQSLGIPMIPGALTPTEIVTAWNMGASCVKVFPIMTVGGANYINYLQGPLREIPLIPTGGVDLDNAREFIQAGAIAVGLGGQLFPQTCIRSRNWPSISNMARKLINRLEDTRK
ncbi:4-Hydroxy-2-oxoglutarate aldolase [Richelia intracellularis HH01]|uniref:4-Hydroxy-2-oxoglutarate aldolase n=1 Tax=Richelia intracellularis HH01 TaxID=1165094 RepID=M1WXL4_9NOST|nr:bifunctional 4-hydroxy-2-oxoglutarate aldolase/2-dehydro-3-deoxy-phosphogluconate aldolase [Richelia intracellularis]CCH66387.1 4-Hydroxy-2-oxoglutarate aldolase [Richelia intracellularis HH01]HAE06275.1 ketohydroxyglutarate aldolase [Richelia sp.]